MDSAGADAAGAAGAAAAAAACSFFRRSTAALTLAIACGVGFSSRLFFLSRGGGGIQGGDGAAGAAVGGRSSRGTYLNGGCFGADEDDRLLRQGKSKTRVFPLSETGPHSELGGREGGSLGETETYCTRFLPHDLKSWNSSVYIQSLRACVYKLAQTQTNRKCI